MPRDRTEYKKRYYRENRERLLAQSRAHYEANKEHRFEYMRKYREEHRDEIAEYLRDYDLKRTYGITTEKYDELFESQSGVCAICQKPQDRRLFVDHCHASNEVRGLLCHYCNFGIGHFFDDPDLLEAAITYLRKAGKL